MKNATKPPKRKLLGFAEQLGSAPVPAVPMDPSGVGLTKSPIPAGARPATAKANKARVASVSSEAPPPAVVATEPAAEVMVAPAPAITAVAKPAAPPPLKVPPAQVAKSKPGGGPGKFVLIALAVVALVVAGPSLAMLAGTFAYPLIVLAAIVGIWKLYDSSRSKGK
jgi:hypothetical protein